MWHWLLTAIRTYVLHPMHGNGYQWWSGAGSDLGEATLIGVLLKHFNCHERGCWRRGHHHPDHGYPVCKKHYHNEPAFAKKP